MNQNQKNTWKTLLQFVASVLTALIASISTTEAMTHIH